LDFIVAGISIRELSYVEPADRVDLDR